MTATLAHAEQTRDWMVGPQPAGTYANIDVIFPGMQAQIEHRIPFYGVANELNLKVNVLPTVVFTESQVDADLRLVVLSLGGSAGVRQVFQQISFDPGERFDAAARRSVQFGGSYGSQFSQFAEARATLSLPMNDHLVFLSVNGLRFENGADRSFDWRLGVVRDAGMVFRSDSTLFYKHRHLGGIGPQVQILNYALDGQRNTQFNWGFTFTTRPGFRPRNDIFFLSVLFGIGGTVNGVPTNEVYGNHLFKIPVTFQIAYRTVLEINRPSKPGQEEED
ncbi:MAG: hypothetical protein ABW321_01140 [Polyangiales bacterium]